MRTSFVTEFPTATTHHSAPTVTAAASGAGSSSVPATGEYDLVQAFHANDFSGANQDTLPIIVQDHSGNPVSLIADINLDVADNYISQALVAKLGLASSTVSLSSQKQQVVTLGEANDTFSVTPHATISLNLLAGPAAALKKFGDVEFRVFDLPTPKAKGDGISWEPELFLGVRFLRAVGALGLTADFAGNGVVDGVPVLVRDLAFVNSQGRDVDVNGRVLGAEEDRKDEL